MSTNTRLILSTLATTDRLKLCSMLLSKVVRKDMVILVLRMTATSIMRRALSAWIHAEPSNCAAGVEMSQRPSLQPEVL